MPHDNQLVCGIELGGTKSIAVIARGRDILDIERLPTTRSDTTLDALANRLAQWETRDGPIAAIGIASFGPIGLDRARADYGFITSTPKQGWVDVDVVGRFARRFAIPIGFDTDVAGAALAEYRWGAARGCDVAIYLTIGTGIGGGVIVNGMPVHGLIHPEIGHIRVRRAPGDDFAGICPFHGDCLEGLAAGPAIATRAGAAGADIGNDHPVWGSITGEIAELMAMLIFSHSPQRIIVGGGVFQQRDVLLSAIRSKTAMLLGGYPRAIDAAKLTEIIVPPALGAMAGPLGAIALAYRAMDVTVERPCPD